jgi:hypothetical protein
VTPRTGGAAGPDPRVRAFYTLAVPLLWAANLGLGVADLVAAGGSRAAWLQETAAALCFVVAGCLAGAALARALWRAAAEEQARRWRRLFETLLELTALEGVDAAALRRLKAEVEEALRRGA